MTGVDAGLETGLINYSLPCRGSLVSFVPPCGVGWRMEDEGWILDVR